MCSDFCQRESRASVTLGPVSGRPKLSQAVCFVGTPAPALASQRREKLPCNPGGEASHCQSLSRRSPTAPFAQGSHLCLGKYNRLSAGAQYGCSVTLVPWRDSHTFFAFLHITCLAREHRNGRPDTGPKNPLEETSRGFLCSHVRRSEHSGAISRKYRAAEPGDGHA